VKVVIVGAGFGGIGAAIDVRQEVEEASDREVQAGSAGTAWTHCNPWYRDSSGRIVKNWPGYMREYVERTRVLDSADFRFVPLPQRLPAAA
jgi:glycine/D-amino acid oxidase-like deaminating enzyme